MTEILVATCPSGKQCSHLLPLLHGQGKYKLRLAAHSDASVQRLKTKYPDAEVVQADIADLNTCRKLLRGATSVFHVGPSLHSREKEMGFNMIDAAVIQTLCIFYCSGNATSEPDATRFEKLCRRAIDVESAPLDYSQTYELHGFLPSGVVRTTRETGHAETLESEQCQ